MSNPFRYAYKIKNEKTEGLTPVFKDGKLIAPLPTLQSVRESLFATYQSDQFSWKSAIGTAFITDVFGTGRIPMQFFVQSKRTGAKVFFTFSHKTNDDTATFVFKHSLMIGGHAPAEIHLFNT